MKYIWTGEGENKGFNNPNNWRTEMDDDTRICKVCCVVFEPESDTRHRICNSICTGILVFLGWAFCISGVALLGVISFCCAIFTLLQAINGKTKHQCPKCKNSLSIPLDTPEGKKLFKLTKMLDTEPRKPLEID